MKPPKHPRTMQEAFGPYTDRHIIYTRRPDPLVRVWLRIVGYVALCIGMLLLATALLLPFAAHAQGMQNGCGSPPLAPTGFYYVCMCDGSGGNCQFVLVSRR